MASDETISLFARKLPFDNSDHIHSFKIGTCVCKWKKLQVSLFSVQNTIVHVIEKLYGLFSFIFLPSKLTDSMKAGNMPPQ
jgi:hypothetical protein